MNDFLQEVVCRLLSSPPRAISAAWLLTVLNNVMSDHWRKEHGRGSVVRQQVPLNAANTVASSSVDEDRYRCVRKAWERLSGLDRNLLVGRELYGMSPQAVLSLGQRWELKWRYLYGGESQNVGIDVLPDAAPGHYQARLYIW